MKKVEFMAMSAEEKKAYLESMAKARAARLEKPENVKLAKAAVEKLAAGKRINIFEFEALTGIMFSHNMGDKMKDILALSTNCLFNARCLERMANGDSVCSKCYAAAQQLYKRGIIENTSYNTIALNEKVIDAALIPDLSEYQELRIEAFGDTGSWIAAANYMNIARENPTVNVTAWTKNPDHYAMAIKKGYSKPENFTLIYSSPELNNPAPVKSYWHDIPELIDHVFTVFTWDYITENGKEESFINCGGRNCKTCQLCYKYGKSCKRYFINELLKSDVEKAKKAGWTFGTKTECQDKKPVDNFQSFRVAI